jgi:hypothetical protein
MNHTEQLTRLIRDKHRVLTRLRDIGQRQSSLVAGGDVSALLKLLAAKQQLISELQNLERGLKPFYAQNPESRNWRTPADRAQCAQLADECNCLLEEIVRLERHGAEEMTVRRNEVARQLQQVHTASQVRAAYETQRHPHA